MSKKVKVVAVSGGLQRPSRTLTLVEALIEALGERAAIETRLIELGEVVIGGVGAGIYGFLLFAILAVFVAGLMVCIAFTGFTAFAMQRVPAAHGGVVLGILGIVVVLLAGLLLMIPLRAKFIR